jgi:sugar lactone lactonase YvrE
MAELAARPVGPAAYRLAEGPVWDPDRGRLLWVDIPAGTVHHGRLTPDSSVVVDGSRSFGETVGAVAVAADGELLVAGQRTVFRVAQDGAPTPVATVVAPGHYRLNDGAVDPAGRFLVGSLALDGSSGRQVLVRLDPAGPTVLDEDLSLSNGLAWSPDGHRMYSIDTTARAVWVRDYDPATGATGARRLAFDIEDGLPDGMCTDADGNLWIAIWGGGRVECRSPGGQLLATVAVDAPHPSSATFAGPDLDILLITTAYEELTPAERVAHPSAGHLFTVRPGVRGLPVPYWNPATVASPG